MIDMTLLKAYLSGTNDPFVLAKVFLEEELLKSAGDVNIIIREKLGWDWQEEFESAKTRIGTLIEDLKLARLNITNNKKMLRKLKTLLGQEIPEWLQSDEEVSISGEWRNLSTEKLEQGVETVTNRLGEFEKESKEIMQTIKDAKIKLENIKEKRDIVTKEITKTIKEGGLTWEELQDPSEIDSEDEEIDVKKINFLIHKLGLELLEQEKKDIELFGDELAEIMAVETPEEIIDIIEERDREMGKAKKPNVKVNIWEKAEKRILEKLNAIVYESTGGEKVGQGKSHPYYKKQKYTRKLNELKSRIKSSKKELDKIGDIPKITSQYWESLEQKVKTPVKDKTSVKYKKTPEKFISPSFESETFWEAFMDGSSTKNLGNKAQFKKVLLNFLHQYEASNEKGLQEKPKPVMGDSFGINVDTDKGNENIQDDRYVRLENLKTLRDIFEEFGGDLKNSRSVSYILEVINKEITREDKLVNPARKKEKSFIDKSFDNFNSLLNKSYNLVRYYDGGEYPEEFIKNISTLVSSGMTFDILEDLSEGKSPEKYGGISVELSKNRLNTLKRKLNSKSRNGKTLLFHIKNVWDSEEVSNYGKIDKESLEALNDGIKLMEDELSRLRLKRKRPGKITERPLDSEKTIEVLNKLLKFLEKVEDKVDDELTSEELLELSKEYKSLGTEYQSLILNTKHTPTKNQMARTFNKINNTIKKIFGGSALSSALEPLSETHQTMPHKRYESLSKLVFTLRDEIDGWVKGTNPKFLNKDGKPWSEKQVREYIDLMIPPADSSLLDPRLHGDYKPTVLAKIKRQRAGLINKILKGKLTDLSQSFTEDDLNWIYTQTGRFKVPKGKPKEMLGRYEDETRTGGAFSPTDETLESDELTSAQAKELFGEKYSEGYEETGDTVKDRADEKRREREREDAWEKERSGE